MLYCPERAPPWIFESVLNTPLPAICKIMLQFQIAFCKLQFLFTNCKVNLNITTSFFTSWKSTLWFVSYFLQTEIIFDYSLGKIPANHHYVWPLHLRIWVEYGHISPEDRRKYKLSVYKTFKRCPRCLLIRIT